MNNTGNGAIYSGYDDSTFYTGNLIKGNSAGYTFYESKATVVNNTIVNNTIRALAINMNSNVNIYNSIVRNNSNNVCLYNENADPNFYNCNIEGDSAGFTGPGAHANYTGDYENCIDVPAGFVDEGSDNYNLIASSPCINAGKTDTTGLFLSETDLNGYNRVENDTIDIGAYERDLTSPLAEMEAQYDPVNIQLNIIHILFSETIEGLELTDIVVTNGSASNLVIINDGTEYSVDITAVNEGEVTVSLPEGAVTDLSGNINRAAIETYNYNGETGIENYSGTGLKIFPNPVYDLINIETDEEVNIFFTDMIGKQVMILKDFKAKTIDISELPAGIYIIKIQLRTDTVIKKIIKN
jgi:hypothetical protein